MSKRKLGIGVLIFLIGSMLLSGCAGSSSLNNATSWPGLSSADDDVVYVAYATIVRAVQNGTLLWSYPAETNAKLTFYAAPAFDDKYVYAGSYANEIHVLNKTDGTLARTISIGSSSSKIIGSPVIDKGKLFVVSSSGAINAYDTESGTSAIWSTTLGTELWTKPVITNGKIYVAGMDKTIRVIDEESGKMLKTLKIDGAIMTDPVLVEDEIYFSTLAKAVEKMDIKTDEISRIIETTGEIWSAPLVIGDAVIAADMTGTIYCSSAKTGESLWKLDNTATQEKKGFIASPVQLTEDEFLLVSESGDLMVYDLEGKSVQVRSTQAQVLSTPIVAGETIIVGFPSQETLLRGYDFSLKEAWILADAIAQKTEETTAPTEEKAGE